MIETSTQEIIGISKDRTPRLSLADQAHHLILDQMLRGSLPLGSILSRRKLAEQFRMSLVPETCQLLIEIDTDCSGTASTKKLAAQVSATAEEPPTPIAPPKTVPACSREPHSLSSG
jgi:hypothetical protein